jgi:hypothetical protein
MISLLSRSLKLLVTMYLSGPLHLAYEMAAPAVNQRCYGVVHGITAHNAAVVATVADTTDTGDLR